MKFKDALADVRRIAIQQDRDTLNVNDLLVAIAVADFDDGALGASAGHFTVKGQEIGNPSDYTVSVFATPGCLARYLTMGGDDTTGEGKVPTNAVPSAFTDGARAASLGEYIGSTNLKFLRGLGAMWERVAGTGVVPRAVCDNARRLLTLGVPVYPVASKAGELSLTGDKAAAWAKIAAEFQVATKAYAKSQFSEAVDQTNRSAANVEFWDTVYTVVEAVADAPANAVKAVTDGVLGFVGGFLATNWLLVVIVLGGGAAYFFRHKLFAKAQSYADA